MNNDNTIIRIRIRQVQLVIMLVQLKLLEFNNCVFYF